MLPLLSVQKEKNLDTINFNLREKNSQATLSGVQTVIQER